MANIIKSVELQPNDSHKSFYKKAIVHYHADGSTSLQSYSTIVAQTTPDGKLQRTWNGYSATTGRHIKAYCGLNKSEYLNLPYTKFSY